jgi:hypothetical protein
VQAYFMPKSLEIGKNNCFDDSMTGLNYKNGFGE